MAKKVIKKSAPKTPKKKVTSGILSIDATFNNTKEQIIEVINKRYNTKT